jgi:hypothetical protein
VVGFDSPRYGAREDVGSMVDVLLPVGGQMSGFQV